MITSYLRPPSSRRHRGAELRDDDMATTVDDATRPHSIALRTAAPATTAQYTEIAAVAVGLVHHARRTSAVAAEARRLSICFFLFFFVCSAAWLAASPAVHTASSSKSKNVHPGRFICDSKRIVDFSPIVTWRRGETCAPQLFRG